MLNREERVNDAFCGVDGMWSRGRPCVDDLVGQYQQL